MDAFGKWVIQISYLGQFGDMVDFVAPRKRCPSDCYLFYSKVHYLKGRNQIQKQSMI